MRTVIKKINTKFLKELKFKRFSLFLITAFVFLMLSKLSETMVEEVEFRIEIIDLPDNIQLRQDSSFVLNTRVRSSGFNFLPLSFGEPKPIVLNADQDLKRQGNNTYLWDLGPGFENLQYKVPEAYDIVSVNSDSIVFQYDLLSSKIVPILLQSEIQYALGYDLKGELTISQDSVMVIGPLHVIDSIQQIRSAKLELTDMKNNINTSVKLINPETLSIKLDSDQVEVHGEVKRFTEGSMLVPVELINVPYDVNINYFPKEMTVIYYTDLDSYKKIKAEDFRIVCDYLDYEKSGEFFLNPQLIVNSHTVKTARINNNRVDFIFL